MQSLRTLLASLLDAFVSLIEPAFTRMVVRSRWVAVEEADDLSLYEVTRGRATLVARSTSIDDRHRRRFTRARSAPVELRLSPDRVVCRPLRLPAASRDYLEPIIEHRLERLTPWRPDKVLYGFAVLGNSDPDGEISVDFAATSRDIVADSLRRLEAAGLTATAIGVAGEPLERPLGLDLLRGRQNAVRRRLRRQITITASVAVLLLVPFVLASVWSVYAAERRLNRVESQLADRRQALQAISGGGEARGHALALISSKQESASVVVLIDRLAALLPSDTFLTQLEIQPTQVRLVGVSRNAPTLIGILEAEGGLRDVRFAAPVTRDAEARDSFEIVAARVLPGSVP